MTTAKDTRSAHVMSLLLYVMIMTHVTMTSTTSVNRINYRFSFQQFRPSKIVVSEFIYDFILTLPDNDIIHRSETITACNVDSTNKKQIHTRYKSPHDNDTPHTINCSLAIQLLIKTLHETDRDIHGEVNDLIAKIMNELPKRINLKKHRPSRAWLNAIGNLLKTAFGTMDETDSNAISERLKTLKKYTEDTSKINRI